VSSQDKKQVMLPNSYHVASMDFDQDTIVKQCTSFIESNLQKFNNVIPLRAAK
jgi:carboxylesterase